MTILELFGGIRAPHQALNNLGIEHTTIDYVEFDKKVVNIANTLYDTNYECKSVIGYKVPNTPIDILIGGSPCQDFSTAGLRLGGVEDSNTRSSLIWEQLRILKETMPKYYIWENVKGVLTKQNIPTFNKHNEYVKSLGYQVYYEVLNAKDFGIPQTRNRVFVIAIRNDLSQTFNFNNLKKLEMQPLSKFINYEEPDLSYYIKCNSMKKAIINGRIRLIGEYTDCITTKQDRWNNAGAIVRPITELYDVRHYTEFTNFIVIPRGSDGECINGAYNRFWKINDKHYVGTVTSSNPIKLCIPSNMTALLSPIIPIFIIKDNPYYLRILTPKETWLLMGFSEQNFNKVKHLPKSHLYHTAGNSIVVNILEAIFTELLQPKEINKYV